MVNICNFWSYPHENKNGTKFNVFTNYVFIKEKLSKMVVVCFYNNKKVNK